MLSNLEVGRMKSLVDTFRHLLADAGKRCDVPTSRDFKTIASRVKDEGDSFVTITLPSFCKDFESSLRDGRIGPSFFPNFRKVGCRPAFLQDYMSKVFDSNGYLLDNPSIACIQAIRQICLFAKKILRPCSGSRNSSAIDSFVRVENEIDDSIQLESLFQVFSKVADIVISSTLDNSHYEELVPRHGPGAVIEKLTSNKKWFFRQWTDRLEQVLPASEFLVPSVSDDIQDILQSVNFVPPAQEPPVKVVFVPKTLKTPRVIAVEPVHMQYVQQGILRWMTPRIESGRFTAGHVNFTNQQINQSLAERSSVDCKLATLDMSEASDRVSYLMARHLYKSNPFLWDMIDACRSTKAKLPNGKILSLKKFASMGSALCFPTEALIFFTIIVASRIARAKLPVSSHSVYTLSRDVYVYGDDLIVPADEASAICADLELLKLKVNKTKSFWTGKFRESCGSDFYDGSKVTPCYLRRDLPADRTDASAIISIVSTCNQLFDSGYKRTAIFLKGKIELIVGLLPTVSRDVAAVGWFFHSGNYPPIRYSKDLHRFEYQCHVPTVRKQKDQISDYPALAKCFHIIGVKTIDSNHLLESVGVYSLTLKRRWVSSI